MCVYVEELLSLKLPRTTRELIFITEAVVKVENFGLFLMLLIHCLTVFGHSAPIAVDYRRKKYTRILRRNTKHLLVDLSVL